MSPTTMRTRAGDPGWGPDRLIEGYQSRTWVIEGAERADGEPQVDITATLVRRGEPCHGRAVLYVHGWNDYFFQTDLADFWESIGFDFYALDLRRYGRNLRRGLYAGYISSLRDYQAEIDEAFGLVLAEGHDRVTLSGHSTGGLILSLWAAHTDFALNGLVLNSPWLDMNARSSLMKTLTPLVKSMASVSPTTALQASGKQFYARSISSAMDGEWDYDLDYKSNPAFVVRFGWGRAIMAGQAKVASGLGINTPILSMMSASSQVDLAEWSSAAWQNDIVLDVERLGAVSWRLGNHVTIIRIPGALHDMILSPEPVRTEVYEEMRRWVAAYVD